MDFPHELPKGLGVRIVLSQLRYFQHPKKAVNDQRLIPVRQHIDAILPDDGYEQNAYSQGKRQEDESEKRKVSRNQRRKCEIPTDTQSEVCADTENIRPPHSKAEVGS